MEYKVKRGAMIPQKAVQEIGDAIRSLSEANGGQVTPSDVVAAAISEESPLHPHFEWDDVRAAHLYREGQAGYLLRSIVVTVQHETGPQDVRAFHSVVVASNEGHAEDHKPERKYITLERAQKVPDFGDQIIAKAKSELDSWEQRHSVYRTMFPKFSKTFKPVLDFIDSGKSKALGERMPWPDDYGKVTPDEALRKTV